MATNNTVNKNFRNKGKDIKYLNTDFTGFRENLIEFSEKIEVMDIGAAAIAEIPIYKKLLDEDLAHLNAFEGDKRQIEKIQKKIAPPI